MQERVSAQDFSKLTERLVGMPLSRAWQGHGRALFLELGRLTEETIQIQEHGTPYTRNRVTGEAGVSFHMSWRLGAANKVLCRSEDAIQRVQEVIAELEGQHLQGVSLQGQVPELCLELSNGRHLMSFTPVTENPVWALRLKEGEYLCPEEGALLLYDGQHPGDNLGPSPGHLRDEESH